MMKIKVRPYANDNTRFQLDIRFMHPIHTAQEVRRRMLAPAGLDEMHARLWGEGQVRALGREVVPGMVTRTSRIRADARMSASWADRRVESGAKDRYRRGLGRAAWDGVGRRRRRQHGRRKL